MRNDKGNLLKVLVMFVMGTLVLVWGVNARAQKARATVSTAAVETQQPLYTDYKGVRLGMTDQDARAKLGTPAMTNGELDYFVFSDTETAQVTYDASRRVRAISVDYVNGVGAPDYKAVVGGDLEMKNGALYKMARYDREGFWVSYYRNAGPVIIVTITIQKIL